MIRETGAVELGWRDGETVRIPFRWLRGHCPCAVCVSETTGQRMVGVDDVPPEIEPVAAGFVGNYAQKIQWSDGHDTGLYSWDWLDRLRREWQAQAASPDRPNVP